MSKWQYLTVFAGHMSDERLNEIGAQGWELAYIFSWDEHGGGANWLFKREEDGQDMKELHATGDGGNKRRRRGNAAALLEGIQKPTDTR
jgi:hypothetical protein